MLIDFLTQNQIRYECDKSLKEITSFRIGGMASLVIFPDSIEKVSALIVFFLKNKMKYFVMGNGSNLLFSDNNFTPPIVKTDALNFMCQENGTFTFGAGVKLSAAANFAADRGYTGLEFAHGIPGSIGGAVYMNAGAYDGSMSQVVTETICIDENGALLTISGKDHDFSYRHSYFSKRNCIILQTKVTLMPGDTQSIRARMSELMERRKSKQPLTLPSAGSTFKRPEGAFAGALIDQCGLRGYRIGGAAVSDKHCGFIVNVDNASFDDVENLIRFVQDTVQEKTGFFLECEVEIIK